MSKHIYENDFFAYVNATSLRSAKHFLEKVRFPMPITTVLDVGCGKGAWLNQWKTLHQVQVQGLDGHYVDTETLLIEKNEFQAVDLSQPINLERKFSLVQCLEVAEHLNATFSDTIVENIIKHGDIVLFSAAQKGQGGEFHVNEQPINYWVEKFAKHEFLCFDYIRPQIKGISEIEPWYRFNSVLFVRKSIFESWNHQIQAELQATQANSQTDFTKDIDASWLLRNKIINCLPYGLVNSLSKLKQHILPKLKK